MGRAFIRSSRHPIPSLRATAEGLLIGLRAGDGTVNESMLLPWAGPYRLAGDTVHTDSGSVTLADARSAKAVMIALARGPRDRNRGCSLAIVLLCGALALAAGMGGGLIVAANGGGRIGIAGDARIRSIAPPALDLDAVSEAMRRLSARNPSPVNRPPARPSTTGSETSSSPSAFPTPARPSTSQTSAPSSVAPANGPLLPPRGASLSLEGIDPGIAALGLR